MFRREVFDQIFLNHRARRPKNCLSKRLKDPVAQDWILNGNRLDYIRVCWRNTPFGILCAPQPYKVKVLKWPKMDNNLFSGVKQQRKKIKRVFLGIIFLGEQYFCVAYYTFYVPHLICFMCGNVFFSYTTDNITCTGYFYGF